MFGCNVVPIASKTFLCVICSDHFWVGLVCFGLVCFVWFGLVWFVLFCFVCF